METQLNNETRQEIDLPKINGFIHQVTHKYIDETSEQHLNRMVEEWNSLNEKEKQFVKEKGAKTAVSLIGEIAYEYESMPKDREKEIINEFEKAIKDIQEEHNKKVTQAIDYSKIWNETKFVDRKDPIFSDELTINDELFKNAINVIDKFREEPDLLKEISINAWNNYVKNELDYPPVEPDFSEVVAEYDVDMDYAEQVWEAELEVFKDEMEAYEKKWKLSDRNSFIQEKYSNEVEVLQKFYTTNYDLAEKRLEFIENISKELGKENNIELKNISIAKQENTQPTNIQLGDKFLFDNKPYEVYHIREQHDPKIYLEHTAEDGIRDELTYYQSDIVKALKENKIEMIDKRELIENEVTNHDIIKMWADKPEQEQNKEFNLSDFLADVKANFSAEEKAYLRERLLINFRQNEFSPITFQKNSNISKEGVEKVENFYNTFKQENYTPVSEEDLEKYGWNYSNFYVDEKFENKVDNVLKAMEYDENIRTEINAVYLKIKSNIHTKNETMTNKRLEEEMGTYELINYLAGGRRFTADNKKITFTNEELIAKYNEFSDYQKQFFKEKGIREAINQIEEVLESSISKERANSISQNFNDFYKMVAENEKILNAVNEDLKNYKNSTGKAVELNSEQQQMVDEDINKIEKNVGMNARQAIEVNQEKTEDLLNSSIEMAKKFNISVLEAIDKKVQIYQRHSKSATESTAWQLRGDNAIKSYLNSLKETNNKEYMNTNNQNQEQNSAQNEQKEFNKVEYLKNQIKYLGFGESEQLHKNLEKSLNSNEESFILNTTSDRVMDGNKVEFNLKFNKTKEGGVFFNSYEAKLTTKQGEERSHSFKVQKENSITAKEAINLLEGRAVKVHFNKTNEKVDEQTGEITKEVIKEPSFIKLKLNEEKNEYGNYKLEAYQNRGYGIDINTIIEKANLVFANDSEKEKTIKHLEKGNITNVNFLNDKMQQQKGFAVFNPQWKMLNLYDEKMNRVNSNKNAQKSDLQDNQKNNVREQSNKRSL